MRRNVTVRRIVVTGVTAAVYAALTIAISPIAYSEIQCRLSEVLNLLAFLNPVFAPGIVLGCFIANIFSPMPLDMLFGTFATVVAMFCITRTKNSLLIASLWPTATGVIISAEILLYIGPPYLFSTYALTTLTVMVGEFVAMTVIGYPLFRVLMNNKRLMEYIKSI